MNDGFLIESLVRYIGECEIIGLNPKIQKIKKPISRHIN